MTLSLDRRSAFNWIATGALGLVVPGPELIKPSPKVFDMGRGIGSAPRVEGSFSFAPPGHSDVGSRIMRSEGLSPSILIVRDGMAVDFRCFDQRERDVTREVFMDHRRLQLAVPFAPARWRSRLCQSFTAALRSADRRR